MAVVAAVVARSAYAPHHNRDWEGLKRVQKVWEQEDVELKWGKEELLQWEWVTGVIAGQRYQRDVEGQESVVVVARVMEQGLWMILVFERMSWTLLNDAVLVVLYYSDDLCCCCCCPLYEGAFFVGQN